MPSNAVPARNAEATIRIGVKMPNQYALAFITPKTAPSVNGARMAITQAVVQAYWWILGCGVNRLQTSTRSTTR